MGELSFSLLLYLRVFAVPGVSALNRHTCGANSSLCIAVAGLSPGIRPVGAGLCPPTWVAGANSSATEVSPEPSPAGHRDGSMWGRDATGPEPTPAPRWSRPPQTKPHAPNPSPQPSHKLVWDGSLLQLAGEGFLFILPSFSPLCSELLAALQPLM
jgi:hypothetical protein